jgi:ketosteroid isomerase-like protein
MTPPEPGRAGDFASLDDDPLMEDMMKTLALAAVALAAPWAQAGTVPPPAVAERQLVEVNRARVAADQRALAAIADADFRFTGADGAWLGEPRASEAVAAEDVRVRLFGAAALVHGTLVSRGADGSEGRTRYTDAYRWDGAAWRLVSAQLTTLADPGAAALRRETAPAHAPWGGADPAGDDESVLRALNAGYVQAFLDSDVAWYDAHLAPDYLVVFGDGSLHDKGSLLAAAARPVANMRSFPVASVSIRRFGDLALIHAENPYERTDGKKGVNRYTDVWHKRDGRWLCVAAHVTRHKLPS